MKKFRFCQIFQFSVQGRRTAIRPVRVAFIRPIGLAVALLRVHRQRERHTSTLPRESPPYPSLPQTRGWEFLFDTDMGIGRLKTHWDLFLDVFLTVYGKKDRRLFEESIRSALTQWNLHPDSLIRKDESRNNRLSFHLSA